MPAILSFSTTSSQTAGFLPSLLQLPPYFECVAVSQTSDPTGILLPLCYCHRSGNNFPDYPKAGVWPDAYYFSTREFAEWLTFVGVGAYALDRAQALAGNPNPTIVGFLAPPNPAYVVGDGLLPSDLDGQTHRRRGSPNFFVGSQDNNGPYGAPSDALTIWKFHYDPITPGNSTFMMTNTLPTQPFNSIMSLALALAHVSRSRVPQTESIIWAIDSGRCFGLPIATLALTSRWSPISRCLPEQGLTAWCQVFAGGNCAVPIVARLFSRKALMRLVLPMGFIAGWEASP